MNLVKRLGIVLLVLIFFLGAWLTIHLLEKPKPLKSAVIIQADSIQADSNFKELDTIETKQHEEQLTIAESEFLNDSSFIKQNASNEAGYLYQKDSW